jgi:hypothetical protein
MKKLFSPFKAVFSLGWLGWVILLLAGSIFWTLFSQSSAPFDGLQERMYVLGVLEADVQQSLNQMKLNEARKIFFLQYEIAEDQDYAGLAEASDAQISAMIKTLTEEGYLSPDEELYISDYALELQAFDDLRSAHRQTFNQAAEAYQAGDLESGSALLEQMQDENKGLDTALNAIVVKVEQDRVQAHRDFPEDINLSIYIATGGLTFALLLALVGYQLISSAVRPLKNVTNTITAIEGDQYRAEMQGGLLKKSGPAGELARALDQLAQGIQQRDAGLKTEGQRLRKALYESRRRRLKVNRETNPRSDKS